MLFLQILLNLEFLLSLLTCLTLKLLDMELHLAVDHVLNPEIKLIYLLDDARRNGVGMPHLVVDELVQTELNVASHSLLGFEL
jgi:hypothetical protein